MSFRRSNLNLRAGSFLHQTRPALFVGFGGLLLLMTVLGLSAISSMYRIEVREAKIRQDYLASTRALDSLRSSVFFSGTSMRDFLLDSDDRKAEEHRAQFLDAQRRIAQGLEQYRQFSTGRGAEAFRQFSDELSSYLNTLSPALNWDAMQRKLRGYAFMQEQVLPRRMTVLSLSDRIQAIEEQHVERSSEAVSQMISSFRTRLIGLMILALITGVILAAGVLWRLLRIERESDHRFQEVLRTREELKKLSAQLLSAQETERRRISRELHDEVGQILSAITFGLGSIRSALLDNRREEALRHVRAVEEMTQRNAALVRDIALLLRPTMLDDLGLTPALRWLAREIARTTEIQVDVVTESFLDDLPDDHRTCIYRVTQEAVRNAVRHSGAKQVRIYLHQDRTSVTASIQDDGTGFDPLDKGLGILGMEERAVHLGGELHVDSERGRGTIISLTLPLPVTENTRRPSEAGQVQISPLRTA